CRLVRAKTAAAILFLSARGEEGDRIVGLELGGDDYLAKPFSPRELVARVRAVFRRIGSRSAQGPEPGAAVRRHGPIQLDSGPRPGTAPSSSIRIGTRCAAQGASGR